MEDIKIINICVALLNRHIKHLKQNIEYFNADGSLDVYTHVEAILNDAKNCPPEKLQFFYDKLKEFYQKKNPAIDSKLAA